MSNSLSLPAPAPFRAFSSATDSPAEAPPGDASLFAPRPETLLAQGLPVPDPRAASSQILASELST